MQENISDTVEIRIDATDQQTEEHERKTEEEQEENMTIQDVRIIQKRTEGEIIHIQIGEI